MKSISVFTPLRRGPFARYLTGEAISMIGTWMQLFAQGWVLTSLTPSAFMLGSLNFTSGLPMLLLSLTGGSVADRFDKRVILHAVLIVQILSAVSIGWLVGHGQIQIWHLFLAAAVLGTTAAFEVPAVSAFVPELVPKDEMSSAIAADRSVFHATRLIGPALGGYLVGRFGASSAYYANAASFLALMAALLTIPRKIRAVQTAEEKRADTFMAGIHFVRGDEPTRAMILLIASTTVFVSPFLVIAMPVYTRILLGLEADRMGLIMAISGVGSLVGSLGLLSIHHGYRAAALKAAAAAVVVAMIGMATAHSFAWAAAAMVLLTVGLSTCFGISNIVIQERARDEIRGRISAVAGLAFFGLLPFSGLLITWLIDFLGMRQTLCWCSAGFATVTTFLLWGRKRLATVPSSPSAAILPEPAPAATE